MACGRSRSQSQERIILVVLAAEFPHHVSQGVNSPKDKPGIVFRAQSIPGEVFGGTVAERRRVGRCARELAAGGRWSRKPATTVDALGWVIVNQSG
jgi:hypothetical protein